MGGVEGEVYLSTVYRLLRSVYLRNDKLTLPEDVYNLPDREIFKILEENQLDEKGTYWFLDTEGFDLMSKYVHYRSNTLFFLWQYHIDTWNGVKTWGFPGQLFSAKLLIPTYIEVNNKFRDSLTNSNEKYRLFTT